MKKAAIFYAMFTMATFAFGQGLDPKFTTEILPGNLVSISQNDAEITIVGAHYDCVAFTRYSDWRHEFAGDSLCVHSWFYAEEWDVNNILPFRISSGMYCPCGCSTQTSEARICKRCFRGEFRVRYEGFDMVIREESTYSRLRKKAPKN